MNIPPILLLFKGALETEVLDGGVGLRKFLMGTVSTESAAESKDGPKDPKRSRFPISAPVLSETLDGACPKDLGEGQRAIQWLATVVRTGQQLVVFRPCKHFSTSLDLPGRSKALHLGGNYSKVPCRIGANHSGKAALRFSRGQLRVTEHHLHHVIIWLDLV